MLIRHNIIYLDVLATVSGEMTFSQYLRYDRMNSRPPSSAL